LTSKDSTPTKIGTHKRAPSSAITISVLKGLWFPIITQVTNVIIERDDENSKSKEKAFVILTKILKDGIQIFSHELWKEILSQCILPMLEEVCQDLQLYDS